MHTRKPSESALFKAIRSAATPAFVYDEAQLSGASKTIQTLLQGTRCRPLYSLKACSIPEVVEYLTQCVDGFAASSLNEVRLANNVAKDGQTIHFTSPGLRPDEVEEVIASCDYISFNSLSQWHRFGPARDAQASVGLRVNPQLSFVSDQRYDPCRKRSKLGVPLDTMRRVAIREPARLRGLCGIHIHANCDSTDLKQLAAVVERIDLLLAPVLRQITWINLGGGFLLSEATGIDCFLEMLRHLREDYGLEVFIEPGAALVRSAGWLVASVVDIFEADDASIAVLDTSVCHWPEVFEFGFQPAVVGQVERGAWTYTLAGASCLAGDLFGEYAFDNPIEVGSRVVFADAGAYSVVKASCFNGIDLPRVYVATEDGELVLVKSPRPVDGGFRYGAKKSASV